MKHDNFMLFFFLDMFFTPSSHRFHLHILLNVDNGSSYVSYFHAFIKNISFFRLKKTIQRNLESGCPASGSRRRILPRSG